MSAVREAGARGASPARARLRRAERAEEAAREGLASLGRVREAAYASLDDLRRWDDRLADMGGVAAGQAEWLGDDLAYVRGQLEARLDEAEGELRARARKAEARREEAADALLLEGRRNEDGSGGKGVFRSRWRV